MARAKAAVAGAVAAGMLGVALATPASASAGPDLAVAPFSDVEDARPGDELTIPLRVTNNGDALVNGFTVRLSASYGLTDLTRYDACVYTSSSGADYAPMSYADCSFDQVLAPGDTFEPPEPLTVRLAPHALDERLDIDVEPAGGAEDAQPEDNYLASRIGADNTADFAVTGDAVTGAAGDTVTARLTFANNGPAWFGNLGSGEPAATVRLIVPDGTTVTGAPSGCTAHTLSGGNHPDPAGAPRYDCALPYWVLEDPGSTERPFAFPLRVDTVLPGVRGAVSIHPSFGEFGDDPFDFDPDLTNNTAALAVN